MLIFSFQETVIRKALPILEHIIKGISNHDLFLGQCFKIADLGCSSIKNTLLVEILNLYTSLSTRVVW
ncbi:putative S-adenosyl-L-methionine-dependent methyltransferase [Helianthus anomalus]